MVAWLASDEALHVTKSDLPGRRPHHHPLRALVAGAHDRAQEGPGQVEPGRHWRRRQRPDLPLLGFVGGDGSAGRRPSGPAPARSDGGLGRADGVGGDEGVVGPGLDVGDHGGVTGGAGRASLKTNTALLSSSRVVVGSGPGVAPGRGRACPARSPASRRCPAPTSSPVRSASSSWATRSPPSVRRRPGCPPRRTRRRRPSSAGAVGAGARVARLDFRSSGSRSRPAWSPAGWPSCVRRRYGASSRSASMTPFLGAQLVPSTTTVALPSSSRTTTMLLTETSGGDRRPPSRN